MRKKVLLAAVFLAVVSLTVAFATNAFAFPGYTAACTASGCHGSAGDAPVVTLVSTSGTSATYHLVSTGGLEWAVFSGGTRVAGASNNGATGTFTVPVGSTYAVYVVYDFPGTATSGAMTTVSPTGSATSFSITPSAGANGSISPTTAQTVSAAGSQTFAITPDSGYHVADVLVDGASVGAVTTYTFSNVTANHTIAVTFQADGSGYTTYTITPSAGANGSISPAATQTIAAGQNATFTITPNSGYHIADVKVDGASVGAVSTYTFSNVHANHTITVTFAATPAVCTITPTAGWGGTISPSTVWSMAAGSSITIHVTPNTGYHVDTVMVDGVAVLLDEDGAYTFSNVNANHTISATFAVDTFAIVPSAGANGSISPATTQTVAPAGSQTFTITPNSGYHISAVLVDGVSVGAVSSYTFSNVNANHTISATFALNTCTITPTVGWGGSISPSTVWSMASGSSLTVHVTPNTGYHVGTVMVDGVAVLLDEDGTYTFSNVTANHTISATFALAQLPTSTSLKLSAKTITHNHYVTVTGRLSGGTFSNTYVRVEYKKAGSSTYSLLKNVKVSSTGALSYKFKVTKKGTFYYRLRFIGTSTYLSAPVKSGTKLVVK